ncbi:unnamed protein product [Clonostachys solani]|uniref:Uncharacterized protein n=1 Tax=Clonostachys solani TaxID=160281 RepID=A0A9N9ZEU2_9HYPO|nr:unnamed protein product [Clonostachys solani]
MSLITVSSSPPRPQRPPRRRQKAPKRPTVQRPDVAAPAPRYGDCITLSPSSAMSSTPQPVVPEELSTPASTQQKGRAARFLGPSSLYRPRAKRAMGDDAEMPNAKRARPDLQVPTPTPLALQNQTVVSPDGEVILSPITARKRSRMPTSFGARRGNPAPPEPEAPAQSRRPIDTRPPPPAPAPVPEEQSPASPNPFQLPEEKGEVNRGRKDSQIQEWLKRVKTVKRVKRANTQLTPPTSVSSCSLDRATPAQPTIQPSPTCRVPAERPKKVEVVSISSDSSSEPPSEVMSEHHSVHSHVSASKSTSKKQGSEYESAHELLSTHEAAHVEDDIVETHEAAHVEDGNVETHEAAHVVLDNVDTHEVAHVEDGNVEETAKANGPKSGSPELNKDEGTTPRRRVALDILASIF